MNADIRMTANEIRRNYNEAKDKPKQITILADMNMCKRSDIKQIIDGLTDELPSLETKKKAKKQYIPSTHRQGQRLSDKEKDTILRMHKNGKSNTRIADTIGRAEETVRKFINRTQGKKEAENVIFAEEFAPAERDKLTEEVTETTANVTTPLMAPLADLGAPEIAGAIMDCLMHDFAGYIIEIKATADTYTVRVKGDAEEIVHTKRRTSP